MSGPPQYGQPPYGGPHYDQSSYGSSATQSYGGQYPPGGHHRPPYRGPPNQHPAKRQKGNAVVTRYPPPPNYRQPSGQQNIPYNQGQYPSPTGPYPPSGFPPQQQHHQGYPPQGGYPPQQQPPPQGYGPPPPQGYPPPPQQPPYQPPPNYQQNQGYPPQPQQYPQQPTPPQPGYPPHQQYPPQQYPPPQGYSPQAYQQPPPPPNPGFQGPPNQYPPQQQHPSPYPPQQQGYQGPHGPPNYPPQQGQFQPRLGPTSKTWPPPGYKHQQDPNFQRHGSQSSGPGDLTQRQNSGTPSGVPADAASNRPASPQPYINRSIYSEDDDWNLDFDGALWPKATDPINNDFSIGITIWHPPKPVTRALPATYDECEELNKRPNDPPLENGNSVSIYFTLDNSWNAYLNIRQTDYWEYMEDDVIFKQFPDQGELIHMDDVRKVWRRRPSITEKPDAAMEGAARSEEGEVGDTDSRDKAWNVMDNLEQALIGEDSSRPRDKEPKDALRGHSPYTSTPTAAQSHNGLDQEGTDRKYNGSPKGYPSGRYARRSSTNGPSRRPSKYHDRPPPPPPDSSRHRYHPYDRDHTRGGANRSRSPPRQESIRIPSPFLDAWGTDSNNAEDGQGPFQSTGSPRSVTSNRTQIGSDFSADNDRPDAQPAGESLAATVDVEKTRLRDAARANGGSRKRSYADTDLARDTSDAERQRQHDDPSSWTRKKMPRSAAAYGRR